MAVTWFVEKTINGKKCKVHYAEWEYIGGSKIQVSKTEYLDEANQNTAENVSKAQGEDIVKSKR